MYYVAGYKIILDLTDQPHTIAEHLPAHRLYATKEEAKADPSLWKPEVVKYDPRFKWHLLPNSKETWLKALDESIAGWEKKQPVEVGPDNCALCQMGVALSHKLEELRMCDFCPVQLMTGLRGCENTPYETAENIAEDIVNEGSTKELSLAFEVAKDEEVEFLKRVKQHYSS